MVMTMSATIESLVWISTEVLLDRDQVSVEVGETILKETVNQRQIELPVEVNDPVPESCHPPEVLR